MSVLIKGTEMPENCCQCIYTVWNGRDDVCRFSGISALSIGRQSDCPLIEVSEDVQPVKHGKWILHSGGVPWDVIECSECGENWYHWQGNATPNYCSNCGADMRGE